MKEDYVVSRISVHLCKDTYLCFFWYREEKTSTDLIPYSDIFKYTRSVQWISRIVKN